MSIAIWRPRWSAVHGAAAPTLVAEDAADPVPADDDVEIAIESVALIGAMPSPGATFAPGGAAVGRVVGGGRNCRDLLGHRVLVGPHQACGECDVCRRGGAPVCPRGRVLGAGTDGLLRSRAVCRARWLVAFGGALDVPGPAAALIPGEATLAYTMYARTGVGPREPTVVVGDGAVARFLVEILVAKGAPPLVVGSTSSPGGTDASAPWPTWLRARGAGHTVLGAQVDDAPAAREATRAALRASADGGSLGERPWRIFACDPAPAALRRALDLAGPRATVTLAPSAAVDLGPSAAAALAREALLIGVAGPQPDLVPEVTALAVRGELDIAGAALVIAPGDLAAAWARPAAAMPTALVIALPTAR